jgi:hypothetical protein
MKFTLFLFVAIFASAQGLQTWSELNQFFGDSYNSTGGSLNLSWKDCCDASCKASIDSLEPSVLVLGETTKIVGKGALGETLTSGTYSFKTTALGVTIANVKDGNVCGPETVPFSVLGVKVGEFKWPGMTCPNDPKPIELDMEMTVSGAIPKQFARTSSKLEAIDQDGNTLLCVEITTAP